MDEWQDNIISSNSVNLINAPIEGVRLAITIHSLGFQPGTRDAAVNEAALGVFTRQTDPCKLGRVNY